MSAGSFHTVVWTAAGEVYTFGCGQYGALGHGGNYNHPFAKVVDALSGKKVVGVSAGSYHTVVWTERGELYHFGKGDDQYEEEHYSEHTPRLVFALEENKVVVGASAGYKHTVVWTDAGELWNLGNGHDMPVVVSRNALFAKSEGAHAPRLFNALVEKKVVGASTGSKYTVAWTERGELHMYGRGGMVLQTKLQDHVRCLMAAVLLD